MHTRLWGICARESAFCFPTIPSGAAERKKFHRFKQFRIFIFFFFPECLVETVVGCTYLSLMYRLLIRCRISSSAFLFFFAFLITHAVWTALLFGCAAPTDLPRDRLTLSLSLSFFLLIFSDKPTNKPGKRKRKKREEVTQQVYTFIHYKWPRVFRLNEIEERLIKYGPSGWVISIAPYGHLCLANE
jgi:hypothetical protein